MTLTYTSTRGGAAECAASEAIIKGIADDGGLFVPGVLPAMPLDLKDLKTNTYQETAYEVMSPFLGDFEEAELKACIEKAYGPAFESGEIAPLVSLAEDLSILELFHGPTLAFKDMALSILPRFMQAAKRKNAIREKIVILTATSGDTGKAALEGFAGVEGTEIIVFFPEDGVSAVQKLQMVTQEGDNTHVAGIRGNFDDAQSGVKRLFTDEALAESLAERGYRFSSANSINIGRLIPQMVYYFHAYGQLLRRGAVEEGDSVDFGVPTGNFGNILAGYYAKRMGLPIRRLVCASNDNRVLTDFFDEGVYDKNRPLVKTQSPSMDILVSSNLERLLYELSGRDPEPVAAWMRALSEEGVYQARSLLSKLASDFEAGSAGDAEGRKAIREVFETSGYLMDTHTAVAYAVHKNRPAADPGVHTVILSTASPFKFPKAVLEALDPALDGRDEIELLEVLAERTGKAVPAAARNLRARPIVHRTVCGKEELAGTVEGFLGKGESR